MYSLGRFEKSVLLALFLEAHGIKSARFSKNHKVLPHAIPPPPTPHPPPPIPICLFDTAHVFGDNVTVTALS
jgi:hypothetical protein